MIYFILAPDMNRLKIGFAENPRGRLSKLQTDSPCPVELLAFIEGGVEEERELHQRFAAHRIAGEWFDYSGALRDYVAGLPPAPEKGPRQRRVTGMAEVCGIGKSYMSDILSGKTNCPVTLLFHIYRQTGWRHPNLAQLDHETLIELAEKVPWRRKGGPAVQVAA